MTDDLAFETFAKDEIASQSGRVEALFRNIQLNERLNWHAVLVEGSPEKDFIFRV